MPSKEHLTFESQTPSFLRRLRGETSAGPSGEPTDPHRHATPQIRARKARDQADIEDDEPVYVDAQTGDVLSKDDARRDLDQNESVAATSIEKTDAPTDLAANDEDRQKLDTNSSTTTTVKAKEITAGVGTARRKTNKPRAIGGDEATASVDGEPEISASMAKRKAIDDSVSSAKPNPDSKTNKKGKKVKLSFNDDD